MSGAAPLAASSDPHVFLIGRPPIGELIAFIKTMAVDGQRTDIGTLTAEWRAANDHVRALEAGEAGIADNPPISAIPDTLSDFAAAVMADPVARRAFQSVPTDIAMIDLDRAVVFQKFINLTYVDQLKRSLGEQPSAEDVFNFVLPLQPAAPPVYKMQNSQNVWTFLSSSTDLRFLGAEILQPQDTLTFGSNGRPVSIIGLAVGYGSNLLNVIHFQNRIVLANGSHRAYALRDLGVTMVPCLLQHVTRREELEIIGSGDLGQNPDRYLASARPPLLRDYFDPLLRKIVDVYRKNRVVRIQFGLEQSDIPAQQ